MRISRLKTEYLCMENGQNLHSEVEMRVYKLKRVHDFKYLGSTVQADGGSEKEICKRIVAGWCNWKKITGIMCDRRVAPKLKGRLFKVMVRPAMLYGLETVAMTKKIEQKMQVAELKMMRYSLGISRIDRIRNDLIRGTMKIGELKTKLREDRLRWYGHVVRREEDYVGNRVRILNVGTRKRGRPKRRWSDSVKEGMEECGLREEDAANRNNWRRQICTGDPDRD